MLNEFTRAPHSRKPPVIYTFQSDGDYASRRGVPSLIRHAPSNSRFCIISRCFYCTWGLINVAKQKPQPTITKGHLARYISIHLTRDLYSFDISNFYLIFNRTRPSDTSQVSPQFDILSSTVPLWYPIVLQLNEWKLLTPLFIHHAFYIVRYRLKKKSTFDILPCRDILLSTVWVMTSLVWRVDQYSRVASWVQLRCIAFLFLINGRDQCFRRIAFSALWHRSLFFLAKFCRLETLRGDEITAFRNYFNNFCKI